MPSIISYRKFITRQITRELLPFETDAMSGPAWTELATVDGVTYVCLPDGVTVPAGQPREIAASIAPVVLTPELRAAIAAASPHVRPAR